MKADFSIRPSIEEDVPAMAAIYGHHVLKGTGTFEVVPPENAEIARRWRDLVQSGMPWLVAVTENRVVGYAYAGLYRAREAYRFTVEDSVYVDPGFQGQGIGKALLEALITTCRSAGYRQMIAVIGDSQNEGSIRVHQACGFEHVGMMKDVGLKFERWLDVVIMQLRL